MKTSLLHFTARGWFRFLVTGVLALLPLFTLSLRADVPAALHISRPVADPEGLPAFRLDWNAVSNATYLVQSATSLAPGAVWTTLDAVCPASQAGTYQLSVTPTDSTGLPRPPATYYRLILPQPRIFSVEPAIVAPGMPVDFYVLGQCFPTNAELRIKGLPMSGTLYQSSSTLVQPSFLPDVAGDYQVSLVVSGQVVSSFTVVCADPLARPELVLQGPPTEPPASPSARSSGHAGEKLDIAWETMELKAGKAAPPSAGDLGGGNDGSDLLAIWLGKKGYEYYQARSDMAAASPETEALTDSYLKKKLNSMAASGPPETGRGINERGLKLFDDGIIAGFDVAGGKKGLNAVNVKLASRVAGGGDDCDDSDPTASLSMRALMKAKEKANRSKAMAGCDLFSGEVQACAADLIIPGRELDFVWARTYHSCLGRTGTAVNGWTFSYDVSCAQNSAGGIDVYDGTGRKDTFTLGTNGVYTCPELFREGTLSNNTFTLTFADNGRWVFNPFDSSPTAGLVHQVITRNGSTITLTHNAASGRLEQVVDDLGRTNTITCDTSGRVTSVTDFSGRTVRYEYDGFGDLVACISPAVVGTPNGNDFPGGKTNRYSYTSGYPPAQERQNHLLLACVDALGQTNVQFTYDLSANSPSYLRCTAAQCGANPPTVCTTRGTPHVPVLPASLTCTVNDPVGNVTEYVFDARGRCLVQRDFTGRATPGSPVTDTSNLYKSKLRQADPDYYESRCTWNNDSLCTTVTSPGGQQLRCVYQSDFDPATRAGKRADCRVVRELASSPVDLDGDGVAETTERVGRYDYDPRFGTPEAFVAVPDRVSRKLVFVSGSAGSASAAKGKGLYDWIKPSFDKGYARAYHAVKTKGTGGNLGKSAPQGDFTLPHRFSVEIDGVMVGGFPTSATDPRGQVTQCEYDAQGNARAYHRRNGAIIAGDYNYKYTAQGQLTAITNAPDASGYSRVDTFTYYASGPQAGCLQSCTLDAGGLALSSTFEYDARGNLTRYVDPRTNDWLFAYNSLDQCVRAQQPRKPQPNILRRCATDFVYDSNDNLVSCSTEVLDAADNLIATSVDRAGYDSLQRLTECVLAVDPSHVITNRFVYDANGQCVQALGPDAVSGADPHQLVACDYDERGLPFRVITAPGSPLQSTTQCDYDANGLAIRVTDGLEGTPSITTLAYDGFAGSDSPPGACRHNWIHTPARAPLSNGAKAKAWMVNNFQAPAVAGKKMMGQPKIGEATAAWVETVWNKQCVEKDITVRCAQITDPMGNVTTFSYDANDNLKVVRHFGETNDVPGSAGNVRLAETRLECDGLDRLRKVHALHFGRTQAPVGDGEATTTFAYALNGDCTSVTDDLGLATSFGYDTAGRCSGITAGAIAGIVVARDACGNVTSVTQTNISSTGGPAQVFTCTYAYDQLSRLVSCTDGAGNTSSCAYDSLGHVVRVTDGLGNDTTCAYDFMGDCLACVSYAGSSSLPLATVLRSSSATYDQNLRCVSTTDANGNPTSYAYDTLGNCILVTRADGTHQQLVWSPRSNLQQATDPNGTVSVGTYDLNDCLVRRDITMGGGGAGGSAFVETFAFDGCDRLVSHHDDDCDGAFVYDSLGSCVSETLNDLATSSTCDALGNRLSLTYPGGRVLTYAYDVASRCTGITESGQALASYDYTGFCLSKETCGNGVSSQFAYDGQVSPPNAQGDHGFGQVSQVRHTRVNGAVLLSACKATWDQKQNKSARTVAIPGPGGRTNVLMLAYDPLDQLVQSAAFDGTTLLRNTTYGLDRMGNRTNVTGALSCSGDYLMDAALANGLLDFQMNQYTATACEARSYDANGNLISRLSGTGATVSYAYDYDNRLVAVQSTVPDGTGGTTVSPVASCAYDALGRRVSKTVFSGGLPPSTRQYCYDGTCAIEERQNSAVAASYVERAVSAAGASPAPPLTMRLGTQDYFVHTDDQGNALALTSANGAVVECYDYDDYGAVTFLTGDGTPTSATSSAVGNPYCWGGLRLDAELGLHNDDAGGYFDPQSGRDLTAFKITPKISKESHGKFRLPLRRNNPWSSGGGSPVAMKNGTVKFFNEAKGFGFIKED